MIVGTWPGDAGGPVFIRGYEGGTYEELIEAYHRDATLLLDQGYEPQVSTTSRVSGALRWRSLPR